jgi:hypothetical protein
MDVVEADAVVAAEVRKRLGEVQQRLDGAGGNAVLTLGAEVFQLVQRAVLGADVGKAADGLDNSIVA